ncbi:MAG: phosphate ABC transporter substrate-binding protein [bacterium]
MKKHFVLLYILILLAGCTTAPITKPQVIKIKGSDTMFNLTLLLAEEYMKNNANVSIYVEGGGSTEGITALIQGQIDISTASRLPSGTETKLLADYYGSVGMFYLIAKDGITIYLNHKNKIKNISHQNLQQIFTGKFTNWSQLGGDNSAIIPVTRPPNSGTFLYLKEHILEGSEFSAAAIVKYTTKGVIEEVSDNVFAIGYGGIGFKNNDDIFRVFVDGIAPTEENVRNDTYPLTRYLHFFTTRTPEGAVKNFIDWVLSPAGQIIIKKAGFIPLWEISF